MMKQYLNLFTAICMIYLVFATKGTEWYDKLLDGISIIAVVILIVKSIKEIREIKDKNQRK